MSESQLLLFGDPPARPRMGRARAGCRRTDPETSRMASRRIRSSGGVSRHCTLLLEAAKRLGGGTYAELAVAVGLEPIQASRRLPEMERAGSLRRGEVRHCRVKGSRCIVWCLVGTAR